LDALRLGTTNADKTMTRALLWIVIGAQFGNFVSAVLEERVMEMVAWMSAILGWTVAAVWVQAPELLSRSMKNTDAAITVLRSIHAALTILRAEINAVHKMNVPSGIGGQSNQPNTRRRV
jgi:hypothetical protein